MIDRSEFVPYAPSNPNEQVRVNHDNCPAGTDTRKRLYVKRLTDGTILCYCHNCGEHGYSRSKVRSIYTYIKNRLATAPSDPKDLRMPRDSETDATKWPSEARHWFYRYGIKDEELKQHGIAYSVFYDRIIFPLYVDGEYIGWQGRAVHPREGSPKYITTTDSSRLDGNFAVYGSPPASVSSIASIAFAAVIVEDCVSAIKISRHLDGIATLGTNPTDEVINWIAKNYRYAFLWFDNDNQTVREKQIELYRFLQVLLPGRVELVTSLKGDPKNHTDTEIKTFLGLTCVNRN